MSRGGEPCSGAHGPLDRQLPCPARCPAMQAPLRAAPTRARTVDGLTGCKSKAFAAGPAPVPARCPAHCPALPCHPYPTPAANRFTNAELPPALRPPPFPNRPPAPCPGRYALLSPPSASTLLLPMTHCHTASLHNSAHVTSTLCPTPQAPLRCRMSAGWTAWRGYAATRWNRAPTHTCCRWVGSWAVDG